MGFLQDMFADVGFKGFTGYQVDLAAKKFFQSLLKPQKSDKTYCFSKFNENVNITVWALVAPDERTEQSKVGNCIVLLQFRQMLLQEFSYLFAGIGRFHVHVAFITRWVLRCQQAIKEAQKGQN